MPTALCLFVQFCKATTTIMLNKRTSRSFFSGYNFIVLFNEDHSNDVDLSIDYDIVVKYSTMGEVESHGSTDGALSPFST